MVMSAHAGSSSLDFPFWEALAKVAKKPLVIAVPRDAEAEAVSAAVPSAKVRVRSPSALHLLDRSHAAMRLSGSHGISDAGLHPPTRCRLTQPATSCFMLYIPILA
jgi:hypothetical protein